MLGHATDFELPTECGTRVLQQWALDHQHLTPHLVRVVGIDIGFSRIGFAMLASTLCENPTDKSPVVVEYTESVDATTQLHRAVTLDELYRYHQHCVDPEIGPFFEKHSHSAIFREGDCVPNDIWPIQWPNDRTAATQPSNDAQDGDDRNDDDWDPGNVVRQSNHSDCALKVGNPLPPSSSSSSCETETNEPLNRARGKKGTIRVAKVSVAKQMSRTYWNMDRATNPYKEQQLGYKKKMRDKSAAATTARDGDGLVHGVGELKQRTKSPDTHTRLIALTGFLTTLLDYLTNVMPDTATVAQEGWFPEKRALARSHRRRIDAFVIEIQSSAQSRFNSALQHNFEGCISMYCARTDYPWQPPRIYVQNGSQKMKIRYLSDDEFQKCTESNFWRKTHFYMHPSWNPNWVLLLTKAPFETTKHTQRLAAMSNDTGEPQSATKSKKRKVITRSPGMNETIDLEDEEAENKEGEDDLLIRKQEPVRKRSKKTPAPSSKDFFRFANMPPRVAFRMRQAAKATAAKRACRPNTDEEKRVTSVNNAGVGNSNNRRDDSERCPLNDDSGLNNDNVLHRSKKTTQAPQNARVENKKDVYDNAMRLLAFLNDRDMTRRDDTDVHPMMIGFKFRVYWGMINKCQSESYDPFDALFHCFRLVTLLQRPGPVLPEIERLLEVNRLHVAERSKRKPKKNESKMQPIVLPSVLTDLDVDGRFLESDRPQVVPIVTPQKAARTMSTTVFLQENQTFDRRPNVAAPGTRRPLPLPLQSPSHHRNPTHESKSVPFARIISSGAHSVGNSDRDGRNHHDDDDDDAGSGTVADQNPIPVKSSNGAIPMVLEDDDDTWLHKSWKD